MYFFKWLKSFFYEEVLCLEFTPYSGAEVWRFPLKYVTRDQAAKLIFQTYPKAEIVGETVLTVSRWRDLMAPEH